MRGWPTRADGRQKAQTFMFLYSNAEAVNEDYDKLEDVGFRAAAWRHFFAADVLHLGCSRARDRSPLLISMLVHLSWYPAFSARQ